MTVRSAERLAAATLRAVAHEPRAEVRGHRLEVDRRPVGIVVPYLTLELEEDDPRRRGVVDAIGLRLRHSDRQLHLELSPAVPVERIVFELCEQFRCEALADPALSGVERNIAVAFDRWSDHALANRIGDTGTGLVIFTLAHMLRARVLRRLAKENVDDLIEGTRANLGTLVGHALQQLPGLVGDQRAFAEPALEIARLVGEMLDDAALGSTQSQAAVARNRLLVPISWETLEEELAFEGSSGGSADVEDDYQVYSRANDEEVRADAMYREFVLRRLRGDLDQAVAEQAVSPSRLAQRLGSLFRVPVDGGVVGGHDHGRIDRARLAQIVADPLNPFVHARPVKRPSTDAAVTFLVDTSGSMKVQRYQSIAVLCDTFVRALESIDVQTEVLGYSTASWAGGASAARWVADGSPPNPGRLADRLHIVYKPFDSTWRQSRLGLAAMLRLDHYREGIDGEALEWAAERLQHRDVERRYLVFISDGQPMEATTATHNRDGYLVDHLRRVVDRIDGSRSIRLGAVSVDHTLDDYVPNHTTVDLSGTLTLRAYHILHHLFAHGV